MTAPSQMTLRGHCGFCGDHTHRYTECAVLAALHAEARALRCKWCEAATHTAATCPTLARFAADVAAMPRRDA